MTIPELETALLYHITPNERKRLKWYKKHDVVKFVKELGKLWRKYKGEENQKALRKDTVRNWFAEKAAEGNLNPEVFEQYLDEYTKATQFKKDSFTLLKKTETELEAIVLESKSDILHQADEATAEYEIQAPNAGS